MVGEKESKEFIEAQKAGEASRKDLVAFINSLPKEYKDLIATREMSDDLRKVLEHDFKQMYRKKIPVDWSVQ